jgi:hypothetical protein
MAKRDQRLPEIVSAAAALEDELAELEAISVAVRKIKLNSEKNLARAAAELKATLALPDRLAARLQGVSAALVNMQARQQAALEPLAATTAEIAARSQKLQQHMQAFGALGKAAGEVNELLAAGEGKPAAVARAEKQLLDVSERARALFEAARADDFPEVAREADVLKQRMAAMSKRLRR